MDKKNGRANRHLEGRAERHDVAATFQLYRNYKLEGNEGLADEYIARCQDILEDPQTRLSLTEIKLIDFRRYDYFHIDFHNRLTVIVGENGAGKTTIVEGIAKALSWITANIEKENNIGKMVTLSDINVRSAQYAEVGANFFLTKKNSYNLALSKATLGSEKKKDSSVRDIKALADVYRIVNARNRINLPAFVFYSVDRSRVGNAPIRESLVELVRESPLDAYTDCLDGEGNFSKFLDFFSQLENRAQPEMSATQKVDISTEKLKDALIKLLADGDIHNSKRLLEIINQEHTETALKAANSDAIEHLKIVKQAIVNMIPDATDLFVDRRSGRRELKVKINDVTVGVGQLSHGQKSVIAMAADLVRRLILLNPKRENPLNGQGIVIIDEIELHLHPMWQQVILPNFLRTFPEIQFIVTTHSPQVLTTVGSECIRILHQIHDEFTGQQRMVASNAEIQTKGIASSDALARIMGINPIPNNPEAIKLSLYRSFIEKNNYKNDEAATIRQELNEHFGQNHPVMLECDRLIRLQEIKQKLSKPT